MSEGISQRAFARSLRVSDYAVRKAIASGRIPAACVGSDDRGRPVIVDVERAHAAWVENAAKTKTTRPGQLAKAQEALTLERVKREKFGNEQRRGKWVRVDEAQRQRFESHRMVRDRVLNVSSRLASELAAETDPQKVFARLDAELRAALEAAADAMLEKAS